jgi:acyl-CoA hydrolase
MLTNENFRLIKEAVSTDTQGGIILGENAKTKVYRVMLNDAGQILLDPIDIHEQQQWLWQNPEALAAVQRGIQQAEEGEVHDLGSFAQYADVDIED